LFRSSRPAHRLFDRRCSLKRKLLTRKEKPLGGVESSFSLCIYNWSGVPEPAPAETSIRSIKQLLWIIFFPYPKWARNL